MGTRAMLALLAGLCGAFALVALAPGCSLSRDGQASAAGAAGPSSGSGGTTTSSGTGATAGGGASSSGTAGGGATSSGGGCTPTTESCVNGSDDDCDQLVDCDDDGCADHECVPAVSGGLHALRIMAPASCDPALTQLDLVLCEGCGCIAMDPGSCTLAMRFWDNHACSGSVVHEVELSSQLCSNLSVAATSGETVGAKATPVGAGDAVCFANIATVTPEAVRLCVLPQAGSCAGGEACVPKAAGLDCVLLDDDTTCPAGYSQRRALYDTTAVDCDCSCGVGKQTCQSGYSHAHPYATGNCSNWQLDVYDDDLCTDTGMSVVASASIDGNPGGATSASCIGRGEPDAAYTRKTLCCPL